MSSQEILPTDQEDVTVPSNKKPTMYLVPDTLVERSELMQRQSQITPEFQQELLDRIAALILKGPQTD